MLQQIIPTLHIAYRLTTAPGSRLFGSVVEHWTLYLATRVQIPLRLSCHKMEAQSQIIQFYPKMVNPTLKWLSIIINDDFLEEEE